MPILPALMVLERHEHGLADLSLHDFDAFLFAMCSGACCSIVWRDLWTMLIMSCRAVSGRLLTNTIRHCWKIESTVRSHTDALAGWNRVVNKE